MPSAQQQSWSTSGGGKRCVVPRHTAVRAMQFAVAAALTNGAREGPSRLLVVSIMWTQQPGAPTVHDTEGRMSSREQCCVGCDVYAGHRLCSCREQMQAATRRAKEQEREGASSVSLAFQRVPCVPGQHSGETEGALHCNAQGPGLVAVNFHSFKTNFKFESSLGYTMHA